MLGVVLIGAIFVVVPLLRPDGVPLGTLLLFVAIVITALLWGTGPSLVVTLVGIVMLDHLQWYPHSAFVPESTDITVEDILILLVGILIGYLAGQNVMSRKRAEHLRSTTHAFNHGGRTPACRSREARVP
jgi:K+-sensing histidine kinase KdpD